MAVLTPPFQTRLSWALSSAIILAMSGNLVAEEGIDGQWQCSPSSDGSWLCLIQERPNSPVAQAPRPQQRTLPPAQIRQQSLKHAQTLTQLDWVPREQLSAAQQSELAKQCQGRYVEPQRPGLDFQGDPNDAPIRTQSDQSEYKEGETALLSGDIILRQGYRQISSKLARLLEAQNRAEFEGGVIIREPNILLVGDKAEVNTQTGEMSIDNARYLMHDQHARGDALRITRAESGEIGLHEASYTTCPPQTNSWSLNGNDIQLDKESGFGSIKHATLRVKGVPVFYTPYIYFPIDDRRHTGFLYPSGGYNSKNGAELITPYYINIAPNYDATITPRLMTKRAVLLENELRYLHANNSGELGLAYSTQDKVKERNANFEQNRWLFNWQHQQQLNARWSAQVDYSNASDKDYLRDFGSKLNVSNESNLKQQVSTKYRGGDAQHRWNLGLNLQAYKNMSLTASDSYERLPQVTLDGLVSTDSGIKFSYLADYSYFTRDENWRYKSKTLSADRSAFEIANDIERSIYDRGSNEITNANGGRLYAETGLSYRFETPYSYVTPEAKFKSVTYQLSNMDQSKFGLSPATNPFELSYNESPSTHAGQVSLDSGLFLERQTSFFGSNYTHTLEPRLFYLYVPEQKNQLQNPLFDTAEHGFSYAGLWRDSRFSGYDRIGDANRLSIGVTTRILDDSGFETLRFGIGQALHFKDRQVFAFASPNTGDDQTNLDQANTWALERATDNKSPLSSQLVWNLNQSNRVYQDWSYNTVHKRNENYSLGYQFQPEVDRIIDLSYRFDRQVDRYVKNSDGNVTGLLTSGNVEHTDLSVIWPLYKGFNALGKWNYDLTNRKNLEMIGGLEYDSCCYTVRVVYRKWIDDLANLDNPKYENAIMLQFVLKGIGGIGNTKSSLDNIKGFREREERSTFK